MLTQLNDSLLVLSLTCRKYHAQLHFTVRDAAACWPVRAYLVSCGNKSLQLERLAVLPQL